MKIALVVEKFDIHRGGAERSTYELAWSLAELGAEVTVIACQVNSPSRQPVPFRIHQLTATNHRSLAHIQGMEKALKQHLAESRYDIVHSMLPLSAADVYQPRAGSLLHSARRNAETYESGIVRFLKRATLSWNRSRQERIRQERKLCRGQEGPIVAALSGYVARQFQNDYGLEQSRLRIIRNGVRIEAFGDVEAQEQGQSLRALYDPEGKLTLLVFAAENLRLKGLGWLLKAARQARLTRQNENDFRILIATSENYKNYWKRAQKMGLGQHVIFIGTTRQMPALLHMCDAVVLPTYNDACSRVVMEALAAGKPALTTRFNGAADFLDQGKYGIIIENCPDVSALAKGILQLCDPGRLGTLTAAIQTDGLAAKVDMRRHARELLGLYEEIHSQKQDRVSAPPSAGKKGHDR